MGQSAVSGESWLGKGHFPKLGSDTTYLTDNRIAFMLIVCDKDWEMQCLICMISVIKVLFCTVNSAPVLVLQQGQEPGMQPASTNTLPPTAPLGSEPQAG